ncbi:hypothetical protein BpJC7_28650 [Weizmannia acidilactici]|uniref:Putative restriction endonuclease domain-containing protein n=1 Tax=Weizmannia acidilactici TaxID=2607726 RepID=A0A5J4J9S7_9BACI|nr:Uma2 family endonuclease [Weizmannia acidilactici]GER68614.1 hypothetical protein BpJC4_30850 [Weizmannia acidilactici]GER71562.1 hypothetical protein BpJC7_28650 [Weizmannia acidilactici]GER73853.1 hypothetical protein BpPP18_19200 [Weizmannia acidilactici]
MATAALNDHFTYADYMSIGKDNHFEVINGQVFIMPSSPEPRHQEVARRLKNAFAARLRGSSLRVFSYSVDVCLCSGFIALDEVKEWVQPDLAIVSAHYKISETRIVGVPDLIAEVLSPATVKKDRVDKFYRYQRVGVWEYWLVDPFNEVIDVYILKNGKYESRGTYFKDDRIPVSILHSASINGKEIFTVPVLE